jgi:plastocyanin domain-containing protein
MYGMKISKMGLLVFLIVSTAVFTACSTNNTTGTSSTGDSQDAQVVQVSIVGGTYVFAPAVLKKDVPVKLVFDTKTVVGCARSIVIPSFGVRGYIDEKNNVMTFTPTQAGTFNIACSMNMYRGTFTVE